MKINLKSGMMLNKKGYSKRRKTLAKVTDWFFVYVLILKFLSFANWLV